MSGSLPDDALEAEELMREIAPYMGPMAPPVPPELARRLERFAAATGVDPDNVPALHTHRNPVTGQVAAASWPCPQCIALGRTEPLKHGRDFPDSGGPGPATQIPPERLGAYLASFPALPAAPGTGGHRARRKARRQAERKGKRANP